jgi:hypothetical protein
VLNGAVSHILPDTARLIELVGNTTTGDRCVELGVMEFPEAVPADIRFHVAVSVKIWNPCTWEISAPMNVLVRNRDTLHDFAGILTAATRIPIAQIMAYRVTQPVSRFKRGDLMRHTHWTVLFNNQETVGLRPLYLLENGLSIIVKDSAEPMRPLTEDEEKAWCANTPT